MSRRVLIALLAVFLPGGVLPPDVEARLELPLPIRTFVATLQTMPAVAREAARVAGREVRARQVKGIYLVAPKRPATRVASTSETVIRTPRRIVWRAFGLRAPPNA